MHNLSRNSTKNVKKSKERDKKDNLLILNTPPQKKVLERSVPTWVINSLHGLFNSSITSSNNYWWVLTKAYFCIWSSVGWDLGVGMARRSLTENGDYTKFPCWRFFHLWLLVLKGRASTTLERITALKIKNMCSFGCEDDQGTEATRRWLLVWKRTMSAVA